MKKKLVYRITFSCQGKVYEIYARKVEQADLYGFVAIEGVLFGEKSSLVLDPSEEQLKYEFNGVRRTLIPFNAVIRIDEVEKEGAGKILHLANGGEHETGPTPLFPPGKGPGKS